MADLGTSTANLKLTLGALTVNHTITASNAEVPGSEVIPALQELVNAVVAAAEAGQAISCRKGCGACCRQLVPISRTEGERLLEVVEAMPEDRRKTLALRFEQAEAALAQAGLSFPSAMSDRELSAAYFALGIPCPFLEEESCSIHPERPLICREYLVTSPAALCAMPGQDGVTPVAVPKLSLAARALQEMGDGWFPLATLMAWTRTRPKRAAVRRRGTEWVQRFLEQIGRTAAKS
jgi:Fe-S-cluster containining protein